MRSSRSVVDSNGLRDRSYHPEVIAFYESYDMEWRKREELSSVA